MPEINAKQVVLIILAMLSFTAGATTQLAELIGPGAAKAVASGATFIGGLMAAAMAPFLSNTNTAKDAAQLTGVELKVSREATPALAALAVDEKQASIAPASGEERAVVKKAEEGAML